MFENHIALHITDETMYQNYRKAMLPILESLGGGFRYDFKISEVLKSETDNEINRVFVIYFPDKETSSMFFQDPDYLKIKEQYFVNSVASITNISEYEL